jgi:acyl-CoA synthetase (AMP-forming)/AMP-acid ligase II
MNTGKRGILSHAPIAIVGGLGLSFLILWFFLPGLIAVHGDIARHAPVVAYSTADWFMVAVGVLVGKVTIVVTAIQAFGLNDGPRRRIGKILSIYLVVLAALTFAALVVPESFRRHALTEAGYVVCSSKREARGRFHKLTWSRVDCRLVLSDRWIKIARYKIPRYVEMVDAFPLTAAGKAQKFRMQEAMAAELGLS